MKLRRATTLAISLGVLAAGAVAIGPAVASAATLPCASSAKIIARSGSGYVAWAGKETSGKVVKFTGTKVTRGAHFYELHSKTITLQFGADTFTLGSNAIFQLSCSGLAAGDKAIMPSISMLKGSATVKTTRAVEGSIFTEENLVGQLANTAGTKYSVIRKLKQSSAPTMTQKIRWFQDLVNQPIGTTTSKTLTHARINITPYVGPRHGSCRHVNSAVLTTTSSFGHGTAVYHF